MKRLCLHLAVVLALVAMVQSGSAQTLSVVSGNGQLILAFGQSDPLVVLVQDAAGTPVKYATVKWTVQSGQFGTYTQLSYSDAAGHASFRFNSPFLGLNVSYVTSTVTAAYDTQSVEFVVTTGGRQLPPADSSPLVYVQVVSPQPGQLLMAPSGQQGSVPIQIHAYAIEGNPRGGVPNVSLSVAAAGVNPGSTIQCAGGAVLTDANGNAACNLLYGGKAGYGTAVLSIGGSYSTHTYGFAVQPGSPVNSTIALQKLAGDKQQIQIDPQFAKPLVVQVTDSNGKPVSGAIVTFAVSSNALLVPRVATTDADGRASTTVIMESTAAGPVVVTATAVGDSNTVLQTFNLSVVNP